MDSVRKLSHVVQDMGCLTSGNKLKPCLLDAGRRFIRWIPEMKRGTFGTCLPADVTPGPWLVSAHTKSMLLGISHAFNPNLDGR